MKATGLAWLVFAGVAWAGPLFPYQGRLDQNGKPVTGQYALQFTAYNAPTGGTAVWGPESFANVPVVAGTFSVKLGSVVPFDPSVLIGGPLYITVAVQGAGDATFVPLAGRQQLLTTPYATASQQDFAVQGRLGVGGVNPADAGVAISAVGPASNGTTVGVIRLSSDGGTLIADGQSLDSSGTLTLQGNFGQPTVIGQGGLTVNGDAGVRATNIWTKDFEGDVNIPPAGLSFSVNPAAKRNKMYRIFFVGGLNAAGGGDNHLYLSIGAATYWGGISMNQGPNGGVEPGNGTTGLYLFRTAYSVGLSASMELLVSDSTANSPVISQATTTECQGTNVWNVPASGYASLNAPLQSLIFITTTAGLNATGHLVIYESN